MLLHNTVEENLRGMNERLNDTHSGFLILDSSFFGCVLLLSKLIGTRSTFGTSIGVAVDDSSFPPPILISLTCCLVSNRMAA